MRRRDLVLGVVAAAVVVLGIATQVLAQGGGGSNKAFFAVMTGAKEVRAGESAGDTNGRGAFSAILDGRTLCYGIQVKNIANPVAAHIHPGGATARGPVAIPLKQPAKGDPGASAACTRLSRSRAAALSANPGDFYVNVHTAGLPNGAVRGQLIARSR
jgi:CHRD domain-containing protein